MPVPTVNLPVHGSWEFLSPLGHVYDRVLKKNVYDRVGGSRQPSAYGILECIIALPTINFGYGGGMSLQGSSGQPSGRLCLMEPAGSLWCVVEEMLRQPLVSSPEELTSLAPTFYRGMI